jgi:catechol 2,3-dioxygenase-like lactoylglutathione lyase family enzyme
MRRSPTFHRVMYVGLSVRDLRRSAEWYRQVFGLETERENIGGSGWASDWDEVLLRHPMTGLIIALIQHPSNDGDPFSEFRTGLDHVEFEVPTMRELDEWRRWLDELGIRHSGSRPHIVTFRDPDNIQLEFFCPAGSHGP